MKCTIILLISILICTSSFAQSTFYSAGNGNWSDPQSWDKNKLPSANDIIVIQPAHTIKLDKDIKLANVTLRVFGILEIKGRRNFTLNNNSIINILTGGKLISPDRSVYSVITFGDVVKYRGNKEFVKGWGNGTVKGMAYASGSSGDIDLQGKGFVIGNFPVIWQDLSLMRTPDEHIQMVWVTSHETGLRIFEIEKSNSSMQWEKIGTIQSEGNLSSPQNIYSFVDDNPGPGMIYYRIKHIYPDNKVYYSPVRMIKMNTVQPGFTVYPNPASQRAIISFGKELSGAAAIIVYNSNGQAINKFSVARASRQYCIEMSGLNAGIYLVQLLENDGQSQALYLVKQ
jgi:hypothetical protein